jgi:uncharacterized membrane protein YfcA
MWELLLPIIGFLIGTVSAMTGLGGGIFVVPLLTLLYSFAPANAVGTSLTVIVFVAASATVNYSRQKRIYYRVGLILALATVPGALLGADLTSVIPERTLGLIFGVVLIFVALRMLIEGKIFGKNPLVDGNCVEAGAGSERELFAAKAKFMSGVGLSFFAGLASGLLGVGGGLLLVPIMILVIGMQMHFVVATSMFTMIITSLAGVAQHYSLGNIDFGFALLIAVGSVFGAQLGAYACKRFSGKNLRRLFGVMLIAISVQMILKFM